MISVQKILEVKERLDANGGNEVRTAHYLERDGLSIGSAYRYIRMAKAYDKPKKKMPKVLSIDIETAPCRGLFWRPGYKISVPAGNVEEDMYIICYAAKWLLEDDVFGDCVTPQESLNQDDSRVMKSLWDLMNEADILVAHNGDKFDIPIINSRFIENGLGPNSPYLTVDTLKQSWKNFKFSSNKLDDLCKKFGFGEKDHTDFELWRKCKNGDQEALDYMFKYNRNDVVMLEHLYLFLRPWMKGHPNMALYCDMTEKRCNKCMSTDLTESGFYYTPAGKYKSYQCECGAIGRSRFTALTKEERQHLTISTAR